MTMRRYLRHLAMVPWRVRDIFPSATLTEIEKAITASEARHAGQLCFAVEGALPSGALWRGQSARERAIEVFSRLRVWDTEHNNGVLIYLLLADRDVEILADRGLHRQVGEGEWEIICRAMEEQFRQGRYREGALAGIEAVTRQLALHFPAAGPQTDELPDRPVLL